MHPQDPVTIIPAPGIIIVEAATETKQGVMTVSTDAAYKDQVGIVLAVGDPDPYENNPTIMRTTKIKVGDKIVHSTWSNIMLTYRNGKRVRFIRFNDVIGVYKDE